MVIHFLALPLFYLLVRSTFKYCLCRKTRCPILTSPVEKMCCGKTVDSFQFNKYIHRQLTFEIQETRTASKVCLSKQL